MSTTLRAVRDWLIGSPPPSLPLAWRLEGALVRGTLGVVGFGGVLVMVVALWLTTNGWLALAGGIGALWLVVPVLIAGCDTYDEWAARRRDRARMRRHAEKQSRS